MLALKSRQDTGAVSPSYTEVYSRMRSSMVANSSNCHGTALFLAGMRDRDAYVYNMVHELYLKDLPELPKPQLHCLVSWNLVSKAYPGYIESLHTGLVTSLEPLLIANRTHVGGFFIPGEPIEEVHERSYKTFLVTQGSACADLRVAYYQPRPLQEEEGRALLRA